MNKDRKGNVSRPAPPPSRRGLPRWLEAPVAAIALISLSPLLLLLALAIKLGSAGPVFFRQRRIGRGGEPFTLIKLRSMRLHQGGSQVTSAGDTRITAVGRLLRKTKLDELPELWHVVCGEMSLVGPRPEVPRYVDLEDPLWCRVLASRPGLTDPTTLRLRNEEELLASIEDDRDTFYRQVLLPYKLHTTANYLERRTSGSDLLVLLETAWRVLIPSHAPAPSREELERVASSGNGPVARVR